MALLQYFDFPSDDNVATSISSATTNYPLSLSKSIDLMTELQVKWRVESQLLIEVYRAGTSNYKISFD